MKKLSILFIIIILGTLSACDNGDSDIKDNLNDDSIHQIKNQLNCEGFSEYVVVEGICIPLNELVSTQITINGTETIANHMNNVELMNDFVADLTGSTGLAVVSREQFNSGMPESEIQLAGEENQETENLIVKLNEDGFFEQVSFSDDQGLSVEITSNPLALEVYGEFTVVIFEVDFGYKDPNQEFTQKLYDSLYAGGIYLIHNETGKLFATKDVEYLENTYSYFEDHSRNVRLMVRVNEPVVETLERETVDEFGNLQLDEQGKPIMETVLNPILDSEGNPIIFTEAPIKMEIVEAPVYEYFEVERLDDNGVPVLDEDGKPIFDIIEEAILDSDGNQKVVLQELPVLDEDGNLVYVEEFEVEIFIQENREIITTEYSANITDNPLSIIAQRFVDKIISEYYNWNYYRVNNYQIEQHSFANNSNGIFYIEWTNGSEKENSQILKKLSFDSEFEEIVIENYLDITKAGFDECEIIIDPLNNNIICKQWESNLKLYSDTTGLKVIPDSETLQPISFPNGELYFFDSMDSFVEDLGYNTTALYTITNEGTLEAHYIELGQRNDVCYGECFYSVNVDTYTSEGVQYGDYAYADLVLENGASSILEADLQVIELGDFDSTRPECQDANGCWLDTYYSVLDNNGNIITKVYSSKLYYPGEAAPSYLERYSFDENVVVTYQQAYVENDAVCENELGCPNTISLIDETINQNSLWISDSFLIQNGENFIQDFVLTDNSIATYNYEKVISGSICSFETCNEWIEMYFYTEAGSLISQSGKNINYSLGETIPLRIDYTISSNTTVVYEEEVCTSSNGCNTWQEVDAGVELGIYYDQGDVMYLTLSFVDTDKTIVNNDTLTRELCMEITGCYVDQVVYEISDDSGNILYSFDSYANVDYGNRAPYKVEVNINQLHVNNQKVGSNQDVLCTNTTCDSSGVVSLKDSDNNITEIGWTNFTIKQGEKMIQSLELSHLSYIDSSYNLTCTDENGCILNTENYIIVDDHGVEYQNNNEDWGNQLPVKFETGQALPSSNNFEVTFLIKNMEYNKRRINVQDFIYNMQNTIILEDNLYLIEAQSWAQGDDNFILTFNEETNRYSVKYTNMHAVLEITELNDSYIAISDDKTSIVEFTYNQDESTEDFYYFDVENLTEGLQINGVNDLIVDYDGSIYFSGVDNFIQEISGSIDEFGTISIDTEVLEHTVVRIRPIN